MLAAVTHKDRGGSGRRRSPVSPNNSREDAMVAFFFLFLKPQGSLGPSSGPIVVLAEAT